MKLFDNEFIDFNTQNKNEKVVNNEEINQKYIKGEVRIVTEQARYPLNTINSLLSSGNYQLNPDFQRRHRWDTIKKSRLIESFIMNVPIPPIFLYESKFSYYEVMDGLQRLTAIKQFYNNEFKLNGLEEWSELNNYFYKDLPEQVKKGIDRRYLSSIILLQETAKTVEEANRLKQLVFERINSGGVKLEPQETRNAIYNGPLNQLCIKLARNEYLCEMWGIPQPDIYEVNNDQYSVELLKNRSFQMMEDVELVLRFFAFRQLYNYKNSSLKEFLDMYLEKANNFNKELLEKLEILFNDTIKLSYDLFGKKAFYLLRNRNGNWNWYNRPTKVVYDPIMNVLSLKLNQKEKLISKKGIINEKIKDFYKTNYEKFEGRNTNKSNVEERINLFKTFFSNIVGE